MGGDLFNPDASCEDIVPEVYGFVGLFMKIYELDWPDDDEHVATLRYPPVVFPIECSGFHCTGASAWTSPNSGDLHVGTAQIQATVLMPR